MRPAVILNATAFAVGAAAATAGRRPAGRRRRPGAAGRAGQRHRGGVARGRAAWAARSRHERGAARGRRPHRRAGRLVQGAGERDPRTEARPRCTGRWRTASPSRPGWPRPGRGCAATPAPSGGSAIVLANYPNRDGRLANGVGLDTPASCVEVLRRCAPATASRRSQRTATSCPALAAGPTNDLAGSARAGAGRCRWPPTAAVRAAARRGAGRGGRAVGPPERDPHLSDGAFALACLPLGRVGGRAAAGARLPHRPGGDLPRARPRPAARLPRLLPLAAPGVRRARRRPSRQARQPRVAAGQGHGPLGELPARGRARAAAPPLPVHRQRPRRGHPGQAPRGRGHRRPPHPAPDPGGELGRAGRARGAGRRVPRGGEPRSRAASSTSASGSWSAARPWASPAISASSRRSRRRASGPPRQPPVRAQGAADPRRPARLRPVARGGPAHRPAGGAVRLPRGRGEGGDASLLRALAADLGLDWDPLGADLGGPVDRPRPAALARPRGRRVADAGRHGRAAGAAGARLVAGERPPDADWTATRGGARPAGATAAPAVASCGGREIAGLLHGLDGRRVPPGPSGAPTRGRPEVLPTGRNFYSVDTRAVPTPAAWHLGWRSAELWSTQYLQSQGACPRQVALSAWGTANMRTGGDDIAQALALLGCRPGLGRGEPPRDRRRGAAARRAGPAAGRRDLARLGLLPRRVPGADRAARRRGPGGGRARRAGGDNPLAAARRSESRRWRRPASTRPRRGGARRRASSAASPAPTGPACRR